MNTQALIGSETKPCGQKRVAGQKRIRFSRQRASRSFLGCPDFHKSLFQRRKIMQYLCELINDQGFVEECFYREGESAKRVQEGLECFCWAEGKWRITAMDDDEENENSIYY